MVRVVVGFFLKRISSLIAFVLLVLLWETALLSKAASDEFNEKINAFEEPNQLSKRKPPVPHQKPQNPNLPNILIGITVVVPQHYAMLQRTLEELRESGIPSSTDDIKNQNTTKTNNGGIIDTIVFSHDHKLAKKFNLVVSNPNMTLTEWKHIYGDLLHHERQNDNNDHRYDWYLRCPSTAYIHFGRLQRFLKGLDEGNHNYNIATIRNSSLSLANTTNNKPPNKDDPMFLGWKYTNPRMGPFMNGDSLCQLWNRRATELLLPKWSRCQRKEQNRHDFSWGKCLKNHVGLLPSHLPPLQSTVTWFESLCEKHAGVIDESQPPQWLYPKALSPEFNRMEISHWLALAHPEMFQPKRCNCTMSLVGFLLQECGRQEWSSPKHCRYVNLKAQARTVDRATVPLCPINGATQQQNETLNNKTTNKTSSRTITTNRSPSNDEPVAAVMMDGLPAFVISLHPDQTQKRVDRYFPHGAFDVNVVEGRTDIAELGVNGYRQSILKVLTLAIQTIENNTNLTTTTSSSSSSTVATAPVIGVFDDDFRVAVDFDERWKRLTSSPLCYHRTLQEGGVVLLGSTCWTKELWTFSGARYPIRYDGGMCMDANAFVRGSFASLFSLKAAKMAARWIEVTPPTRPFDWFWMDYIGLGYPVRTVLDPLIVADVEHPSTIDPGDVVMIVGKNHRKGNPTYRHRIHKWGPIDAYMPPSGEYP